MQSIRMINKLKPAHETRIQLMKFIGVGVLNTSISLVIIYLCMSIGFNYKVSNFLGYIIGVTNSFFWNKYWVFKSKEKGLLSEMLNFGICFGFCFAFQYVALALMVERLAWNAYLSQFVAMGLYTVSNFVLNRIITFKKK